MKKWWYPTAFSCWDDAEQEAIDRVRASGQYTMGPEVLAFEREFAKWHGRKYGVMVNSGSSANLLMIAALCNRGEIDRRLRPGDVALVPALAWSTTYAPLAQHGLTMKLLDCDKSWNANTIRQKGVTPGWNPKARLVVGCSILGNPAELDNLLWETVELYAATFIEDNCESFGAVMPNGRLTGTYGLMSSYSFFYSHQISAIEGGIVLTDELELYHILKQLRSHGWTRDILTPMTFASEYNFTLFGYNLRPTEMHAAIARAQLKKQNEHRIARWRNVIHWRQLVRDAELPITHQFIGDDAIANPFGLSFTVPQDRRTELAHALRAVGIDCRLPTGGSFRCHKYGMGYQAQQTPYADHIHTSGMFLGNGPLDLSEQITKAVSVMKEVLL